MEQTRHEWYTPTNLATYFEVARDVMLDARVAIRNHDFDPEIPYFEEVLITHPERICSYDETKMELDCTRSEASKRDRCIRDVRFPNNGETVVTKSSSCASVACGWSSW